MRLSAIYAVPFSPLVSLVTSPTAAIAIIGRCNALSPFATAETRKLDPPKRSVELTTRGIRIPFPSSLLSFRSPLRPLHLIRVHRISTQLEIPHRLRKTFDPIFVIPSSDERAVSFLYSRFRSRFEIFMAYTLDPPTRYYDADGAKIVEKDVWPEPRART